ncbi:MAG: radical SAM protein [Myxococcales bacterium]|nr:radical SAM protein [Myxococcales bacterium]
MYDVGAILEDDELREPLRRSVAQGLPPAYLRSVKLKITARCNLKCMMCRYGRGWAPPELPTERWIVRLSQMAELGCRKVHFSGGEVLVRKDFEALVAHAAAERMKVTFTSNLTLLTRERAKAIMRSKVSSISTSLDGADAKTHEGVRGIEGSFKRTLRAIEWLTRERERRGRRTRLRINFVMMRHNYAHYPELVRIGAELGASDVIPMPVDTKRDELRVSKRMIRHYNEQLAPEVERLRRAAGMSHEPARIYPFGRGSDSIREAVSGRYAGGYYQEHACYAPYLHMFVAWDGRVYLCCMTNGRIDPLGDLSTQSVREVFAGEAFQRIRAQMMEQRLPACHACDMFTEDNRRLATRLPGPRPGPNPELAPTPRRSLTVVA